VARFCKSSTSAGVQLAVQQAKGWSRLGDSQRADASLRMAGTVLSRLPRPEHPEHHFVFEASKLSFYAATCYTWLGDREHAREHAAQVIHQCLEVPGQVRWPIRLAETRVDLGLVAAREGEIDEACELGRQALASERKSGSTLGRVAELDAVLMREHPEVGEVVDLHEQFQAAGAEPVGDGSAGLVEHDTLTPDRPLSGQGPVVEVQVLGELISAALVEGGAVR
jgi:hypothetical protein